MKVIGLIGGIGAGKSTVVSLLNELVGVTWIHADKIGHDILLKGQLGYEPVIEAFGKEILDDNLEIDRKLLGKKAFATPKALKQLNAITHPIIEKSIRNQIAACQQTAPNTYIVLEAALLVEGGLLPLTDVVLAVYAEEHLRTNRVQMRDGLEEEEIKRRMKSQKNWEEFKQVADYVIDNSISLEYTKQQLREFIHWLKEER